MGMFDNFIPNQKVICPECGKEISEKDPDFPGKVVLQSKALECVLNTYKQGEPLRIKTRKSDFFIKEGWIEAHTICDKCDQYVQFKLVIENGIWTKTGKWGE